MCGILGFIETPRGTEVSRQIALRMAACLEHRGPDDEGVWIDQEAGAVLAHRRLAIMDLSPAGHQPMVSEGGRFALVLNGEIYNFQALRAELELIGPRNWRGHSDTEVLLAAIEQWGLRAALERCVGMFALAVWDRRERKLSLARDRLGEKPLYYGWLGGCFAFASELKALRAHPSFNQSIDRNSVALFMRHGYVPAPYTIYSGISKLAPGVVLDLSWPSKEPSLSPYWRAFDAAERGQRNPFQGSPAEAVERVEELLRQALAGQMVADVPLGAFLSGGIDSSTVVAVLQSMSARPVKTFTIGFEVAEFNEAEHAAKVAERLGTDHTELYVTEREALEVIPRLPSMYCEPFADPSQVPTFLVSKLARRDVTVSISGDGGDELFSGYRRYAIADKVWRGLSKVPVGLRRTAARVATLPSPGTYDRVLGPFSGVLGKAHGLSQIGDKVHKSAEVLSLTSLEDVYKRLCSYWSEPDKIVRGAHEPPTMFTGLEPVPHCRTAVERMMYTDLVSYLPDDILVKVDRAAMAVSLESRVPLLDHRLVEFAMSLPVSILRAQGVAKWPLRQILYRHVPASLVDRPKMGFGVPLDRWLRGALRGWAEDLLSENRLRQEGFFNPEPIRQAWLSHLSGRRNNQYLLWNVLMFQSWKIDVERPAALAA